MSSRYKKSYRDRMGLRMLLKVFCLMIVTHLHSQAFEMISIPSRFSPFVIFISSQEHIKEVRNRLYTYEDAREPSFLLIDGDLASRSEIVDSINYVLNNTSRVDLQRTYLVVIGNREFFEKVQSIGNSGIFPARYYLYTDAGLAVEHSFEIADYHTTSFFEVIESLNREYLWQVELLEIENESARNLNKVSINRGLTSTMTTNVPFINGFENSTELFFGTISIGTYHRWNGKWQTNFDVTLGINIPRRNQISNDIQEELNSSENADANEIYYDIKTHFYTSISYEAIRFIDVGRTIDPYVGFGLGLFAFAASSNTLEIDRDSPIGGPPGGFEGPEFGQGGFGGDGLETAASRYFSLTSGFELKITESITSDFGIKWNQDLNVTNQEEITMHNLSFYMGLNFRFTKRKKLFYDYVR